MPGQPAHEDQIAFAIADSLLDKARAMMLQAERALDTFKLGKEMNEQICAQRGISATDAEIRWASSARAKNALADNTFHTGLAAMYFGAANAYFTRALYLRAHAAERRGHEDRFAGGEPRGRPVRAGNEPVAPRGSAHDDAA